MKIIFQTTVVDSSSLNDKSEIPNKTLANIMGALIINSSHKKELWCFAYQYDIWISCQTENRLCGDVPYFLWNGTRPLYKHIKIWGLRVYIINGHVTRKKMDDISHIGYFMAYAAIKGVIIYWNPDHPFFSQIPSCLV